MLLAVLQQDVNFPEFIKQLTNLASERRNNRGLKLKTNIGPKSGAKFFGC
jgi:hypothetical protein